TSAGRGPAAPTGRPGPETPRAPPGRGADHQRGAGPPPEVVGAGAAEARAQARATGRDYRLCHGREPPGRRPRSALFRAGVTGPPPPGERGTVSRQNQKAARGARVL